MESIGIHRPRNVDWKRAAALLYGDWGTSKAYVIGFAFSPSLAAIGYQSFPIILAVAALTGLVAYNYVLVCKHFPDGGGVYSAAREQSRFLAVMGALLLVANFTVTAAMSGWAAMEYFRVPQKYIGIATAGVILLVGVMNYFGPKHTGSLAVFLAIPMVLVVIILIGLSLPYLTFQNLEPVSGPPAKVWIAFTSIILALSGVEAIANLTGVMRPDANSSADKPQVHRTARKALVVVTIEVVIGTVILGWAMLSLPKTLSMIPPTGGKSVMEDRWEDMLSVIGEHFAGLALGPTAGTIFGIVVSLVVGLLLLSAVNTAIAALIGLLYMVARDGEMPAAFTRLNPFGVPWWPIVIAVGFPMVLALVVKDLEGLFPLYAIGVVGAIAVNLGSCSFNKRLALRWFERGIMAVTFLVLFAVEITVAKTQSDALFFACCVLGLGFALRAWSQRRAGLRTLVVSEHIAAHVAPESVPLFKINLSPGQTILVAARGMTPVLRYAVEEAQLRKGTLYVLFVKELAITLPGTLAQGERPRWQDDREAVAIMTPMLALGKENNVPVIPLYAVSEVPAATILDLAATLGVDILMLGASHRRRLVGLLKGDVVEEVAKDLPENIQLVIHG